MYRVRIAALSGLVICALVSTLPAAQADKNRFLESTNKLIEAINGGDIPAIENMMASQMQQLLPPDKATPFFGGIITARGKLKEVGTLAIKGPTATVKVSAERGAWTFKITLDASDKIAGLLITPAAKAATRATDDRFTKTAKKLIREINSEHFQAVENMLDAQMQQAVPLDKAAPFFRKLVATRGKLKEPGTPTVTGSTATVRISAERGALDIKFTLDASDKITELRITPAADAATPVTADRFTKTVKKLIDAINGEDIQDIETMLDAQMQQAMPLDKAKEFFHSIITDTGKLKETSAPTVTGSSAAVRVSAERAALDIKFTLDESDKIAELSITPATSTPSGDLAAVPRSDTSSSPNLTDQWVEQVAKPLVGNHIVDGLSIGYVQGEHSGMVHLGCSNQAKEKANMSTVYELGSISKVFTSLLLADAVVRGEIDLNATADATNPAGIRFPSRDGRSIRWIDLSTHRSGLPRLPSNLQPADSTDPYRDYDSKKAAEFLSHYDLPRKPGESQEYSNFGGSVLGYLVAQKAGKSYGQLLRERIAEPLQMTDCTVSPSSDQEKRFATTHDTFGHAASRWTHADLPGAGGVCATLGDMMLFAKAQLHPPSGTVGQAIELAWKQHTEADASGPATGLGWMISDDGETRWHNGRTGGSTSALFINRRLGCAVIVLCNTSVPHGIDELAMKLMLKAAGLDAKFDQGERNNKPPKLSPFTAVRFEDEKVIVTYKGQAYQWFELDGIKIEDIIASSKKQFGDRWQMRVSEDLVEVLWGMDHKPGNTVKLGLRGLKTKQDVVIENAPMTKENRNAIFRKSAVNR
jgi:D-alanyl-D-alanine-carboxypeptidase/D-alanyl-D-alanine-endopeptidase